ncbi:hypothetical protein PDE_09115 [Penicillium oxalicum 114-2]|uniref:DNA double-strand break repair and VJ recombination XRCC4 n=1 Tax=Penicillium oxalicum (strain 114-2 / CGMCC 5302) TaxID=933388 RepID=S7ZZ90_PENO1|nr:hypothetical protein PDE_09115 [Penicillium oxalicum 114-2]
MSSPQVLRIPRSDKPHSHVLVQVSQAGQGQASLDLTLVGTEGEHPYVASIRESRVQALRNKHYQGSDKEWMAVIAHVLKQEPVSTEEDPSWTTGVEASASISEGKGGGQDQEIVITIRKRVQEITQRLGSIILKQDEDQEIALFEWTALAVSNAESLQSQVTTLTDRIHNAEDTILKLKMQLSILIESKSTHDKQLMANFVQLLNQKKLKIRNQQRLLACATPDPKRVAEIQAAISSSSSRPRQGEPGHTSTKRKGPASAAGTNDEDSQSDSDSGFEKMDIDQRAPTQKPEGDDEETDDEDEERSTPQPLEDEEEEQAEEERFEHVNTDEETATDDDDDQPEQKEEPTTMRKPSPPQQHKPAGKSSKPTAPDLKTQSKETTPPPRRELPFSRRGARTGAQAQTQLQAQETQSNLNVRGEDEETAGETDDDEL